LTYTLVRFAHAAQLFLRRRQRSASNGGIIASRPSLSPLFDSTSTPYEICDLQPAADISSAKLKQG
jgi:hypothetical protein